MSGLVALTVARLADTKNFEFELGLWEVRAFAQNELKRRETRKYDVF